MMIIYPAIDIRDAKCVRLLQGNYACETIYNDSPIETAKKFSNQGATWLHVVDLDGAKNPQSCQAGLINKLLQTIPIHIQVGGGIRSELQMNAYLEAGASRVVIGSLAVESPNIISTWLKKYGPERIVLAFDIIFEKAIPYVMTQAWQKFNNIALFDVITQFLDRGVQHVICTDITRDGALNGPNIDLYLEMLDRFPKLSIQASGGISQLDDLRQLKKIKVAGAITGRALYEKKFDLAEALLC